MPRQKKKDQLIPIPVEAIEPESKVEKAIKKVRTKKQVIEDSDDDSNDDNNEYIIERINNNFIDPPKTVVEVPKVVEAQKPVEIVQTTVQNTVQKKPRKTKPKQQPQPIVSNTIDKSVVDKLETEYKMKIENMKKENEMLKKFQNYNDHLNKLSNMSRSMKIKF